MLRQQVSSGRQARVPAQPTFSQSQVRSKQRGGCGGLGGCCPPLRAGGVIIVLCHSLLAAGGLLLGRLRLAKVGGQEGGGTGAVGGAQQRNLVLAADLLDGGWAVAAGVARVVNHACCRLGAAAGLDVGQRCERPAVVGQQQPSPGGQRPGSGGSAAAG